MKIIRQILSTVLWAACVVAGYLTFQIGRGSFMSIQGMLQDGRGALSVGFFVIATCIVFLVTVTIGWLAAKMWTDK